VHSGRAVSDCDHRGSFSNGAAGPPRYSSKDRIGEVGNSGTAYAQERFNNESSMLILDFKHRIRTYHAESSTYPKTGLNHGTFSGTPAKLNLR
jgi:hypothetical protein